MTEERDEDLNQGDEPFQTTHVVGSREYPLIVTTDEDGVIEVLAQPAVLGATADNESYVRRRGHVAGCPLHHDEAHADGHAKRDGNAARS